MRNLSKEDKFFIDLLASKSTNALYPIKDLFVSLFPNNYPAMLIVDDVAYLIADDISYKELMHSILRIITLLSELVNDGYIYVCKDIKRDDFIINNSSVSTLWQESGKISCGLGIIHILKDNIKIDSSACTYNGIALPEAISHQVVYYLKSLFCPTDKLIKFKEDKYEPEEIIKYKRELRLTRWGLAISILALFISLISPICATSYNNKHAISTLESTQYSGLNEKLKRIESLVDSIYYKGHQTNLNTHKKQSD